MMTTQKALTALKHIKTYCNAAQLVELDYVIEVLEKLEKRTCTVTVLAVREVHIAQMRHARIHICTNAHLALRRQA